MKVTLVLLAAFAAVFAQDTVSATDGECEPHGDHWHCPEGVPEPTTPPAAEATSATVSATPTSENQEPSATAACEPHGDHWHCPEGVPEPTTPPAESATTPAESPAPTSEDHEHEEEHEATATACEPHGDHWHCPSGVAEPTTPPAANTTSNGAGDATSTPATSSPSEFPGAAAVGAKSGGLAALVLGAMGALVV